MTGAVAKLKEEVRKILVVAVFFSTGFCLIHVCTRLVTEGSNVKLASLAQAAFGGLIVAKILISVDLLPFVHAFPGKPLVHNIVWKTSLYVAGGVIFLYIEPLIKNLFKGAGLYAAHARAWGELMLPRTWATVIWVAMLLAVFVTLKELSRVIGKDQVQIYVSRPQGQARYAGDVSRCRVRAAFQQSAISVQHSADAFPAAFAYRNPLVLLTRAF